MIDDRTMPRNWCLFFPISHHFWSMTCVLMGPELRTVLRSGWTFKKPESKIDGGRFMIVEGEMSLSAEQIIISAKAIQDFSGTVKHPFPKCNHPTGELRYYFLKQKQIPWNPLQTKTTHRKRRSHKNQLAFATAHVGWQERSNGGKKQISRWESIRNWSQFYWISIIQCYAIMISIWMMGQMLMNIISTDDWESPPFRKSACLTSPPPSPYITHTRTKLDTQVGILGPGSILLKRMDISPRHFQPNLFFSFIFMSEHQRHMSSFR